MRHQVVMTYTKRRKRKRPSNSHKSDSLNLSAVSNGEEKSLKRLKIDTSPDKPVERTAVCWFCQSSEENEVDLGAMLEKNGVFVHYLCMLLSSGLGQSARPSDKKSLFGFTIPDIKKELRRGNRLKCCFCHKKGATIGCCVNTCKRAFHLPCGRRNGTMHQFFGNFMSFCADHWPEPVLGGSISSKPTVCLNEICSMCLDTIGKCKRSQVVFPPCCKTAHFHHKCMQKYALSSGLHYFRCPLCNDSKIFQQAMLEVGIYIPDRDASWEQDSGAFQELLERPDSCSVLPCLCSDGEKYDAQFGDFKLLICELCGAYAAHKSCAGIRKRNGRLICPVCSGA